LNEPDPFYANVNIKMEQVHSANSGVHAQVWIYFRCHQQQPILAFSSTFPHNALSYLELSKRRSHRSLQLRWQRSKDIDRSVQVQISLFAVVVNLPLAHMEVVIYALLVIFNKVMSSLRARLVLVTPGCGEMFLGV
jgi:hypothetical protein